MAPALAVGDSLSWLLCPASLDRPHHGFGFVLLGFYVFCPFLTFQHCKIFQAHRVCFLLHAKTNHSPWSPCSFYCRMTLEIKIWPLGTLVATGMSLALSPVSWHSKEMYVCILAHVRTHICKYFCIFIYISSTRVHTDVYSSNPLL